MKPSSYDKIKLIFNKEVKSVLRNRSGFFTCLMFGITVLSCISFSLQGSSLEPKLQAAILWTALFFTFMACGESCFADEVKAGTLLTLKIYGDAQSVLLGKMLYNVFFLNTVAICMAPIYIVLMDTEIVNILAFIAVILAGSTGIAAAGTLISSLSISAKAGNGIFAVLMLPIVLPILLLSVLLTSQAMGSGIVELQYLGAVIFYDVIAAVGASVLFDYVW